VLALAADGAVGLVQRFLTPAGLRAGAGAFEPDVATAVTLPLERSMPKVEGQSDSRRPMF
jgi:hypothetical protein